MARGATIYRAELSLSLVDRDVYAEPRATVARHPSETLERTLVRVLAWGLRWEPALAFGRGVSATDEPDLWSLDGAGRARQWIEVGQPEGRRLVKATRQAERVVLFVFGEGAERWRAGQLEPIGAPAGLSVARLGDDFVSALAATADRTLRWSLTLSEGILYLGVGDRSLETAPEVWCGDPLG